jgi:hypothetical protein
MPDSPATPDFYSELRATLNGKATRPDERGAKPDGGLPAGSATEPTVIAVKRRVEVEHGRALKSLSELAKRNEEAERRAKATVHALSAKYLEALAKNPDVHEGDPLFFFGYGLECMEDIIHAGFCQVNASVNLYLEELDARFQNLLVMAEAIEAAHQETKRLADDLQGVIGQIEARRSAWLDGAKGQLKGQFEAFTQGRRAAEAQLLEAVLTSHRSLRRAVGALAILVVALGVITAVGFYFLKLNL